MPNKRYTSASGSPIARALGIGYVQELISRLTETRITSHNSSTNGTLDDNDTTFPFKRSLYVDATHEVVILHRKSFGRAFMFLSLVLTSSYFVRQSSSSSKLDQLFDRWSITC